MPVTSSATQQIPKNPPSRLVIASRESRLAMWQALHVQALLQKLYPSCDVSILGMTTQGDQILDRALSKVGGKGLFVKELEVALAEGRADLAVHSLKDVPMELPEGFSLAAILEREDPRDAFVSNDYENLEALPVGAVVGTSSLRREAALRAKFPHLVIQPLRGNLDTRLGKLDKGDYAAIILAAAGLKRLGLAQRIRTILPVTQSLPAAGQGALGIEICSNREDVAAALAPLHHLETACAVLAERAVSRVLGGSCQVPLAAFAQWQNTEQGSASSPQLSLNAFVSSINGKHMLTSQAVEPINDEASAIVMGEKVARALIAQGAEKILAEVMQNTTV